MTSHVKNSGSVYQNTGTVDWRINLNEKENQLNALYRHSRTGSTA